MGGQCEDQSNPFIQKFDRVLTLLLSFCDKSKASFSENISFLLDKSLDHLKILDTENVTERRNCTHLALIQTLNVKKLFQEVFKISRLPFVHSSITSFAINLLVELTKNEVRFKAMYSESKGVFDQIHQLTETTFIENSEMKKSVLNFFFSLSKFQCGRDWLLTSGSLSFIVSSLSDRTVFIRKAAQESICYILPLLDETQREKVLLELLNPVLQAGQKLENHQIESDKLKPYFEVLEYYIDHSLLSHTNDKTGAFLSTNNAEVALENIVSRAENEKMLSQAGSLLVAIYAKNAIESSTINRQSTIWEDKTLLLIQLILRRGFLRSTLNVTSQSLVFWTRLQGAKSFHSQLVHLAITPVLMHTEEVSDHFPEYKDVCQYWKNLAEGLTKSIGDTMAVMLQSNNELNELTTVSLAGLQKCIAKFDKEIALKITRSGMFLLGCLKISDSKRMTVMPFAPQLTINLTKNLTSFIQVYNIRWWESYETTCLPIIFTKLVSYSSTRDTQVACAGLEGLKFCIRQYIHPEQALLVRNSPESTFNDMAAVLQQCTVSVHWEVRDSAMEVVLEMTQLSHVKYPEFQNILIRSGLLEAALSAFNDIESFVRASAIAVVAVAAPVPLLWEHLTAHSDVITSCYTILQQDSEALARRAAARALTSITQSGHFPFDKDRQTLYRNMSAAAISDLDWEVKLEALEFWRVIIDESLRQQGMLDGSFPEITFSKEKQKIVRLDTAEIRSRLQSALSELGAYGCLNVLLQLVDDYDAPVREKSIQLLYYLRGILAKNQSLDLNIWQTTAFAQPPIVSLTDSPMDGTEMPGPDADQVIDEILSVNDSHLIAGIRVENDPKPRPDPGPVSAVNPHDFVNRVNIMELENMLETTWMSSDLHVIDFDSLLDDLKDCVHTDTSRPRPDCY